MNFYIYDTSIFVDNDNNSLKILTDYENTITNINSLGPQGDIGLTGITGYVGTIGNIGNKGKNGLQGSQGFTGNIGPQGYTGPMSITGPIGYLGSTGSLGVIGNTGPIGEIGPTGSMIVLPTGNFNSLNVNSLIMNTPYMSPTGINRYNTGGSYSRYFSNVNYSFINLWIDMETFPESAVATYQDSISVKYNIVFDYGGTPSQYHGICSGIMKLFPKRFVQFWGAYWGEHYLTPIVTADVLNVYYGLPNYTSTASYAPYGRQYYCYNTVNTNSGPTYNTSFARLYGGASFALIQFYNPTGNPGVGTYSASVSLEILDSKLLSNNTSLSANVGLTVYIGYTP
jgi:hypothetical protein